jgi:hypothetical protein
MQAATDIQDILTLLCFAFGLYGNVKGRGPITGYLSQAARVSQSRPLQLLGHALVCTA